MVRSKIWPKVNRPCTPANWPSRDVWGPLSTASVLMPLFFFAEHHVHDPLERGNARRSRTLIALKQEALTASRAALRSGPVL